VARFGMSKARLNPLSIMTLHALSRSKMPQGST
jgi:hypothetical protein